MGHPWLRQSILRELRKAGSAGVSIRTLIANIYKHSGPLCAEDNIRHTIQRLRACGYTIDTNPRSGVNARRFLRERDNP